VVSRGLGKLGANACAECMREVKEFAEEIGGPSIKSPSRPAFHNGRHRVQASAPGNLRRTRKEWEYKDAGGRAKVRTEKIPRRVIKLKRKARKTFWTFTAEAGEQRGWKERPTKRSRKPRGVNATRNWSVNTGHCMPSPPEGESGKRNRGRARKPTPPTTTPYTQKAKDMNGGSAHKK